MAVPLHAAVLALNRASSATAIAQGVAQCQPPRQYAVLLAWPRGRLAHDASLARGVASAQSN